SKQFQLVLIKPSHYDDDGYVIRWWRAMIPSNSLAAIYGIAADCAERCRCDARSAHQDNRGARSGCARKQGQQADPRHCRGQSLLTPCALVFGGRLGDPWARRGDRGSGLALAPPPHQSWRKLLRILDRLGCFSFLSALASI